MTQATKGGETGLNGEFYKGGQFLPNSEETIKGAQNSKNEPKSRKQEIAPYCWQASEKAAIWPKISPVVKFVGKTSYSKETGKTGQVELVISVNGYWTEEAIDSFQSLIEMWNNGEMWI